MARETAAMPVPPAKSTDYQEVCGDVGWTPPGKTSRPSGIKRPSPTPEGRDTRTRL